MSVYGKNTEDFLTSKTYYFADSQMIFIVFLRNNYKLVNFTGLKIVNIKYFF